MPVFIGLGIAIYFLWPSEPGWGITAALIIPGLIGLFVVRMPGRLMIYGLVFIGIGFAAAQLRSTLVAAPVIERETGPVAVTGTVERVERFGPRNLRMTLDRLVVTGVEADQTPRKIRLRVRTRGDNPAPGDRVMLRAVLLPPSPPVAPGAFDFARQAWFKQLGAVGYAISPVEVVASENARGWAGALARFRDGLTQRLAAQVEGNSGAVAVALLTGERGGIPEEVVDDLRIAGLAHLLAISGLHIGMMAGLAFFAVRAVLALIPAIALRYPIKKWAALAGIVAALFYLLVSGATVPTQRAFAMTTIVLIGVMLDRVAISMRLVALVATVMLLLAPENLLSVSFQMSFAAVIALVAVYEGVRDRGWLVNRDRRWGTRLRVYVAGIVLTTLIAGSATGFFAAYHFNRFAVYDIAANVIAVPLMGLWIMPCALLVFLLLPFGLEGVALDLMTAGIDLMLATAHEVASWRGAEGLVPAMPTSALALAVFGGLWLCLWRTRARFLGIAPLAGAVLLAIISTPPDILIDERARVMAVRGDDGQLVFLNTRGSSMIQETWLRRNAQKERRRPQDLETLHCDSQGCVFQRDQAAPVALVYAPQFLAADCMHASVVISAVPAFGRCQGPALVIDRFDLWRGGAHAIWLDDLRVDTVAEYQGRRPWSRYRERK